ncbi:cysteine-rich repeat secretory protein 38-like isoform X1 [Nymphaea colorata]|nr:cysteine-rich repeat secretory protein 38-like isoform X1 [Nymphaea colorata]XP_031503754.1 cysteine-rich repeat secretory protein 38-like isoform X1 [Nymphaea colorata]XP_031503755.1 cysteine-rich repeat secretory protein 38-like isoform X1 [Nymphaea colorata]XP_049937122.1 cysteine-rich repeat secretory protein 38-like isoform X1 [Nymphaea colorata]XP_049937123.1 cysteine-rich repeat secretory protein 38-like isoform X1 [Nymphaea colorata]XP_049937124.1 cysteine-rich repeat secretory prot
MGYSVMVLRMKIGFPLLVLFLLLSFRVDQAMSSNDFVDSYCNRDINYIDGSKFQTNMHLAFATLIADVNPLGFSNAPEGEGSERVYAMVLCRGDIDKQTCKECIDTSTQKVNDTDCTYPMEAIIWYEKCQLCYSNTKFFGHLDVDQSGAHLWNSPDVNDSFNEKLSSLLQNLISQATTGRSTPLFATGSIPWNGQETIYGLMQCTRDTSLANCQKCLETTRSQIPTSDTCQHSIGCEFVRGSCRLRYDTVLFYGTTTPNPPPPSKIKAKPTSYTLFSTSIKSKAKRINSSAQCWIQHYYIRLVLSLCLSPSPSPIHMTRIFYICRPSEKYREKTHVYHNRHLRHDDCGCYYLLNLRLLLVDERILLPLEKYVEASRIAEEERRR